MFKFKLALALGRTVSELEQTMSCREFSQWAAFYAVHPFGAERDNLHSAIIASTIANVHRSKGQQAVKVDDFMIKDQSQQKKAETMSTLAWMDAVAIKKGK